MGNVVGCGNRCHGVRWDEDNGLENMKYIYN